MFRYSSSVFRKSRSFFSRNLSATATATLKQAPTSFEDLPGEVDPTDDTFHKFAKCPFSTFNSHANEPVYKTSAIGHSTVVTKDSQLANEALGWENRGKGAAIFFPTLGPVFGETNFATALGPMHMEWRKQFRVPFSQKTLSNSIYTELVADHVQRCFEAIKKECVDTDNYVDLFKFTRRTSYSIGISYMFGSSGLVSDEDSNLLEQLLMLQTKGLNDVSMDNTPGSAYWQALKAKEQVAQMLGEIVPKARKMYENGELDQSTALYQLFNDSWLLEDSERIQSVETVNGIMFAATDTTSGSMMALFYHIWGEKEQFEKLKEMLAQDEIGAKLIDANYKLSSYEEINATECLHWFVQESQRLVPTASFIFRKATKDNVLGDKYEVPKDTFILVPTIHIHRNEENWGENALEFDFMRFSDKNNYDSNNYVAFGRGNRQCLGMHLAYLELKMVLLEFIRKDCQIDVDESSVWFGMNPAFRANFNAKLMY